MSTKRFNWKRNIVKKKSVGLQIQRKKSVLLSEPKENKKKIAKSDVNERSFSRVEPFMVCTESIRSVETASTFPSDTEEEGNTNNSTRRPNPFGSLQSSNSIVKLRKSQLPKERSQRAPKRRTMIEKKVEDTLEIEEKVEEKEEDLGEKSNSHTTTNPKANRKISKNVENIHSVESRGAEKDI